MRLLVICHEYPPVGGGGGQAARDIAIGLVKSGHEVRVLTAHLPGLDFETVEEGVSIQRVRSGRKEAFRASFLTMSLFLIASFFPAMKLIHRWKPDLIHVHFAVPTGILTWVLSSFTGTPYVLTAHLGDVPGGVPEKTGRWFRWVQPFTPPIWKKAAAVVAVSEFTRQLAMSYYPVQIKVIPNGIDLDKYATNNFSVNQPPIIIFAGRFMPQKNILQLIDILANLQHLDWTCKLLGDGPLMDEVNQSIVKKGITGRFLLPGWVTPEQVMQEFRQSDLLFMPSLSEGLPVVGVQALAMGLAIVASDAGGWSDLVDDGVNGFIISNQDQGSYLTHLSQLLKNPDELLRFRLASRKKAENYNIKKVVNAYEEIYSGVLRNNSTRK